MTARSYFRRSRRSGRSVLPAMGAAQIVDVGVADHRREAGHSADHVDHVNVNVTPENSSTGVAPLHRTRGLS